MSKSCWLLSLPLALFFGLPLSAQPVISARAGLIEFADGVVFLNGDLLRQLPGRFGQMNEGSELRTQAGRAEVILTPGVFLRIGDDSAVQMIANHLADTRLRLSRAPQSWTQWALRPKLRSPSSKAIIRFRSARTGGSGSMPSRRNCVWKMARPR